MVEEVEDRIECQRFYEAEFVVLMVNPYVLA